MSAFTATNGTSSKVPNAETSSAPNHAIPSQNTNGASAPQAPLTGDQPSGDQPSGNQPSGNQPSGDQPSGDQLSGDQLSGDQPSGDQPSGDQPPRDASPTQLEATQGSNSEPSNVQAANHAENQTSHKRKRSDEDMEDALREAQPERDSAVAGPDRPYLTTERDPYERDREFQAYGDDQRDRDREAWYSPHESRDDRHPYSQPASAVPDSAHTEEQMGEALRRATEQDYPQTSPDGDEGSIGYGHYGTPERRGAGPQSDPKKRKRNFSNRTKTGCLTCRRRKKKCDELKPECSNCLKGGFVCEGYPPQRGAWLKPESKVAAIQIESKDPNYKPPGAYGMPQQAPFTSQHLPLVQGKREPLPSYRGQPLRIDPPQGRPLYTDDDRPTASTLPSASVTSPDNNKLSALTTPYSGGNVFPTPVSAAPVLLPERSGLKEYSRVPPLHDLSRTEPDLPSQAPQNSLPHISIMHATRTNSPITTPSSSVAQTTAQLALSHIPPPPTSVARREKDEMLAGRPFFPWDKELVLERERCYATLCRFNNSMNPNNGASPAERSRLFLDVLQPKVPVQLSHTHTAPVTHVGRLGENVVVEAPFTCDYGYNIHIGSDVVIGRNCTMLDACEIKIGNNVVIGPNVSFYTTTMSTDPRMRKTGRGSMMGKPIIIEDDVFIGGNVTILTGVKIGKGTTVGAGSLVTRTLPAFCICMGSPAKVRRGIAPSQYT